MLTRVYDLLKAGQMSWKQEGKKRSVPGMETQQWSEGAHIPNWAGCHIILCVCVCVMHFLACRWICFLVRYYAGYANSIGQSASLFQSDKCVAQQKKD